MPKSQFRQWVQASTPVFVGVDQIESLDLLNCTIRFVVQDELTVLSYSRTKEGSYAFVLYFRMARSKEADEHLHGIHTRLVDIT